MRARYGGTPGTWDLSLDKKVKINERFSVTAQRRSSPRRVELGARVAF